MTLKEGKRFLCVWLFNYVSNFAGLRMEVPRYRSSPISWDHCCFSVFSSSEVLGKILPFRVNCRLQLAGLGKKREETVRPTCFSLLYVESDFGSKDTTDKSFTVFFARGGVKFDRRLKISAPLDYMCRRGERKSIILFCEFWFPCSNAIWYDLRCHVTWRLNCSFSVNSQIRVIKNVSFSLLLVTFSIKANF